jgi:hypothetical protein
VVSHFASTLSFHFTVTFRCMGKRGVDAVVVEVRVGVQGHAIL